MTVFLPLLQINQMTVSHCVLLYMYMYTLTVIDDIIQLPTILLNHETLNEN